MHFTHFIDDGGDTHCNAMQLGSSLNVKQCSNMMKRTFRISSMMEGIRMRIVMQCNASVNVEQCFTMKCTLRISSMMEGIRISLCLARKLHPQSHAMGDDDYHFRHRIDFSHPKEYI